MALQKPSPGLLPAENYSRFGTAFNTIDLLAAQLPYAQQAIEALLTASNSHGNALTTLQQQGLSASQAIAALLDANSSYAQALTELQANDGAFDVLIGSLESLTDAHGKAITAEQSRAATAEALARIIAAPKYSVPLDTITLPNGGAVYWNGSTSTGAGETSGGLRVPQGQTGIFSQHRTRFQPTAAQRTKLAGRPVQFMVAFRSTVGALTALRDSAGYSTLGGVIEGVPSIVGVKIYSIRPDLWLAVGDAVLTGNESVITIALQVSGNTLPVAADVSFLAIGAMFMPVDATGTTDVLADFVQPLALRADNLIAAARIRYAPLLGAGPGVTDRVLVIPAGQSGAGSLAIYGAPVAGLQAGTRVRCRFAIQVAGGAFVSNGVAQSDPPVTLIELFGATVEMTDGSQIGAVAGLTATSPTTYEASVTFTATGAERIAEFYLKVDENSAVRLNEGQIRLGLMFVDVLSTEPTTTVAAQTARLTESFRAFIAAAPDRFRDWCSASSLSDGDYGTIREAVVAMRTGGSQDQPNRVVVLPGTYTNECATGVSINPADYVEIVGKGARRDVEIIARLPDNQVAQDSQQPLYIQRSCRVAGLTVRARNVKYPGHLEAGNAPVAAIWDIDDCEFVHEGATGWTETSALGVGQNDGSKLTATGSTFLSPTSGVGIHNNTAWARGARADFTGCNLIGTGDSATSLAVTSQGAGVMSAVNLRGCVLSGRIHHYVSFLPGTPLSAYRGAPWEYTVRITDSDPVDWLSPCPFDVLTLTSVAAGNSAAAVGNTGAVRLFGRRPDVRAGAADYAARLHSSHLVSVPEGQFDPGVGLGARLGDMRGAAARPLDIFWDGSSSAVRITLDQNYSAMSNAQVVAALNAKLSAAMGGNTGGRAFSLSQPYHNRAPIRQPDREATAVNAGTATILKGHVLAKVGRRVRLMTSTDAASAFAGIALDDAVPGRSVRFLKTGLIGQAHLLFDGDQTFTAGARYQISATNPGRLVPGADLPVLSVRSVEAYGAALEIIGTVAFTGSATEAVRDAFAAITYQDVPGLPAVIDTVVPKGTVGSEPVTLGGVTDTVANRLAALQAGQSAGLAAARKVPLSKFGAVSPGANVQAVLDAAITELQGTDDALVLPPYPVIAGRIDRVITGSVRIERQKGSKLLFRPDDGLCLRCPVSAPYAASSVELVNWAAGIQVSRITLSSVIGLARGDVCWIMSRDPFNPTSPSGGNFPQEAFSIAFVDLPNKQVYVAGKLFDQDKYVTQIEVRRLDKAPRLDIDVVVEAVNNDGSPANVHDASISRANSLGLQIRGFVAPRVRADIRNAWRGGLAVTGSWFGDYKVRVRDLPNIPSANAYGYGVQDGGPSFGNRFEVHAERCRHAFSTVSNTGLGVTEDNIATWGNPAFGHVTGTAAHCYSNAWDTHAEGYGYTFSNLVERSSLKDANEAGVANGYAFLDRARRTHLNGLTSHGTRRCIFVTRNVGQDGIPDPAGVSRYDNIVHFGDASGATDTFTLDVFTDAIAGRIVFGDVQCHGVARAINMRAGSKAEVQGKLSASNLFNDLAGFSKGAELLLADFDLDVTGSTLKTPFSIGQNGSLRIGRGYIRGAAGLDGLFGVSSGVTIAYSIETDAPVAEYVGTGRATILPALRSGLERSSARREVALASNARTWSPNSAVAMLLENATDAILSIAASSTGASVLNFSDSDADGVGSIRYDHSTNSIILRRNNSDAMRIDANGVSSLNSRFFLGSPGGATPFISGGAGSPEGVVSAPPGSRFFRSDGAAGSQDYIKRTGTGNVGWSAIA